MIAVAVMCDGAECEASHELGADNSSTARRWAADDGWQRIAGADLCPTHVQERVVRNGG